MSISVKPFGMLSSGEEASIFLLSSGEFTASLTDFGATWMSFVMPDTKGERSDILLGFSTLSGFTGPHPYLGATIGRFANRIAGSKFAIDRAVYQVAANEGANQLHGGKRGFDKRMWKAEAGTIGNSPSVRFVRTSPDGEEGFPGSLDVEAIYILDSGGVLSIRFSADTDAATPVNLTNHAYFNLRGEGMGDILDHRLSLACDAYLPVGNDLIPTGKIESVEGTVMDFREEKPIGKDINHNFPGYDHCYVINSRSKKDTPFVKVRDPVSGRTMRIATSLPGVQFYSGQGLEGLPGKLGSLYGKFGGFCLEPEFYPDSPNRLEFPSCLLTPGHSWDHQIIYSFAV
jgi:aldose 1-epimerase